MNKTATIIAGEQPARPRRRFGTFRRSPVYRIGADGRAINLYPTIADAAAEVRRSRSAVKLAAENGGCCAGYWWRYADLPAEVQPLKPSKAKPLIRQDGQRFPSIGSAVAMVAGIPPTAGQAHKTERRRLERAMNARKPWRGMIYLRLPGALAGLGSVRAAADCG